MSGFLKSGNSTPARSASFWSDSGKLRPSTSIIKVKMSPPLPLEKSCQMFFSGETIKLGVFSLENGLRAL